MSRDGTGSGNSAGILMRKEIWEKLWTKHFFQSPEQPRGIHLRQQSLPRTCPWVCFPHFTSGTAYGWNQNFSCQGHVHGWCSCNAPLTIWPMSSDVLQSFVSFKLDCIACQSVQLSKPDQMLIKCKLVQMSIYISWGCAPLFIMNLVPIVHSGTHRVEG